MGRRIVELPGGGCATEREALNAMVAEAKRRGISYGKLMSDTTEWERDKLIRAYCAEWRGKPRRVRIIARKGG